MIDSQIIDIKHIGPVAFRRSVRAGRIIITVSPQKGVRVAVPRRASFEDAVKFVRQKDKWIKKHIEKIRHNGSRNRQYADALAAIDRKAAVKFLAERLRHLAVRYGFDYKGVTIRNQKTRWGSCSHNNAISLNLKLVILPEELRDYVMLHELVHTRIHNHSRHFWEELDRYVGNGKMQAAKLRDYDLRQMG